MTLLTLSRHRWHAALLAPIAWVAVTVGGLSYRPLFAAGTIFDANGFDSGYSTGALENQFDSWIMRGVNPASTAEVQTGIKASGTSAVKLTRTNALDGDAVWYVRQNGVPTQTFVTVDWNMRVEQSLANQTTGEVGPVFGIEAKQGDSFSTTPTRAVIGLLGVDSATGEVMFRSPGGGVLMPTVGEVNFGQWNNFRMVFDFNAKQYAGYLNNALLVVADFTDKSIAGGIHEFSRADFVTYSAAPDVGSMSLGGTAYFDNLVIRDGLVGDYNLSGTVDDDDYAAWRRTFGKTISPAGNDADGNKNGVVDAADYVIWRNNLGQSLFTGAGSGSSFPSENQAVPEPSTLALLIAPVLFLGRRTRRLR